MKRIYLFGRIVRILFLISFIFLLYAFVDMYIQSNFGFKNLLLLIFTIIVVIGGLTWIYSMGIFIDRKNDSLKLVIGFSKKNIKRLVLSNIASIDVELKGNLGMDFIINYKYDCMEKIEYKFYRISIFEKAQYKRIKKELRKIQ
ncbi:MAG: hypothetical protein IJY12_03275 [Clostridia bacterium]|nr:hypothetical protein [Clostridia bacterium]